jgi:putative ABC transport system permease protein
MEAISLTVLGGIIGIVLGILGSYLTGMVLARMLAIKWRFSLSLFSVVLAFATAAAIGLAFGIYPARQAAKLSPIESLRYE